MSRKKTSFEHSFLALFAHVISNTCIIKAFRYGITDQNAKFELKIDTPRKTNQVSRLHLPTYDISKTYVSLAVIKTFSRHTRIRLYGCPSKKRDNPMGELYVSVPFLLRLSLLIKCSRKKDFGLRRMSTWFQIFYTCQVYVCMCSCEQIYFTYLHLSYISIQRKSKQRMSGIISICQLRLEYLSIT